MKTKNAKIIEVDDYSNFCTFDSNTIVITATQNLKKNDLFSSAQCVISFADLINEAQNYVDFKESINNTELRFLINSAINTLFKDEKKLAYKNSIYGLEDLFSLLLLNDINTNVDAVAENYSFVEKDIFNIYKKVYNDLELKKQKILKKALVDKAIDKTSQYKTIVLVGFVFFNDMQEYLIKHLNAENLVFINKHSDFISSDLLMPMLTSLDYIIEHRVIKGERKGFFNELEDAIFSQSKIEIKDEDLDNLKICEPFASREEEFKFIAKNISDKIRNLKPDIEQLNSILENFAIVITKNKEDLLYVLDDAFNEFGIFVPKNIYNGNLKSIYYSKQEFLNNEIKIKNKTLNYIEKIKLFNEFRRISFSGYNTSGFETPLGRFIIAIYNVVAKDLDLETFKSLLETQWCLNKNFEKEILIDFYHIECYFEQLSTLKQWKICIGNLIKLKTKINNEENIELHPLNLVKKSSLLYIQKFIDFIELLVNKLKINGNIKKHISLLISTFNLNKIKLDTKEDKEALENLIDSLNKIKANDNIEIDYIYFAENVKDLISQCIYTENKIKDNFKLAVVNMENYSKYDFVYFPMFEENKYPRILRKDFPFTDDIIEILQKLNVNIQKNFIMDYHLKMSRHIFKNVFGFVKKQITFTYICRENNNYLDVSNYAHEIQKTLNNKLNLVPTSKNISNQALENRSILFKHFNIKEVNLNHLILKYLCPKLFVYSCNFKNKISYDDKFLLVFYAKALVINRFFVELGHSNKKYKINTIDFENEVNKIYKTSLNDILNYFDMFAENEKKDICITCKKYIDDFIELHFKKGKFASKNCKFKLGKIKSICGKFIVYTRETLVMINLDTGQETEFDISKNLDLLVSSSGGKKYNLKHFDELVYQLEKGNKFDDKASLVNFISFKLNTQLNNKKFYTYGVERISKIIYNTNTEYSNMCNSPSSYCRFCKLKDICKGSLIDE